MIFLIAVALSFIFVIIYGVVNNYAKNEPKQYLLRSTIVGIILIPIVGLSQGTSYSHGFDIHWYIFGFANFILILVTSVILVFITKIYAKFRNT